MGTGPASLGGSCERRKLPSPWPAPSPGGDLRDRKGASEAQRRVQQLAHSSQNRETCVEGPGYLAEFSAQDESLLELSEGLGWKDAGRLNSGFRGQTRGEDWGWLCGDRLKGRE